MERGGRIRYKYIPFNGSVPNQSSTLQTREAFLGNARAKQNCVIFPPVVFDLKIVPTNGLDPSKITAPRNHVHIAVLRTDY